VVGNGPFLIFVAYFVAAIVGATVGRRLATELNGARRLRRAA